MVQLTPAKWMLCRMEATFPWDITTLNVQSLWVEEQVMREAARPLKRMLAIPASALCGRTSVAL